MHDMSAPPPPLQILPGHHLLLSPPIVDIDVTGLLVRGAEGGLLSIEGVASPPLAAIGVAPPPFLDVDHVFRLVGGAVLGHFAGAAVHGVLRAHCALTSVGAKGGGL